ncbi:MAG: hypothetical protein LBL13_11960 [Bacteroidales bacterium]|jgi:hypothetical protein|nr:hypothetical protein [Bacteroidales bacterium]
MKKQNVKLTKEGLNLVTVLCYSNIGEMSGLYDKEVFFTKSFCGDIKYLHQLTGNLGGHPRNENLNEEIDYVILSNAILDAFDLNNLDVFFVELEDKLNRNNSPYRKIKFISEEQLIQYFENRIKLTGDEASNALLAKYKESKKANIPQTLF